MKTKFILLLLVSTVSFSFSQNCFWSHRAGTADNDEGLGTALDAHGNVFVTGYFTNSNITIGTTTLINKGNEDVFIAKYGPSGNVLWAKSAGGNITDIGQAIATDTAGNCYVTGCYRAATITFDTTTLTNSNVGTADIFLVKYDPNGNLIWARNEGGSASNDNISNALAVDAGGNVYMTGRFHGTTVSFGTTILTNAGGADIFIAKFDSLGNPVWAKGAGGNQWDIGYGIALDASANVYVAGDFPSASITFGTTTLNNIAPGNEDLFLVKYDRNGNLQWAKSAGGSDIDYCFSVAADSKGAYITGAYQSPSLIIGNDTLHNTGSMDIFLAKYDVNGNPLWAKGMKGGSNDFSKSVSLDQNGHLFLTGYTDSPLLVCGTDSLKSSVIGDKAFILKSDTAGNVSWTYTPGSGRGYSVTSDHSGFVNVTGSFQGSTTFGTNPTLTSAGGFDAFVASTYSYSVSIPTTVNVSCNGDQNGSAIASISGGYTPYTYSWTGGANTQSVTALFAGTYTVMVTDANGCANTSSAVITQPAVLSASISAQNINCSTNTHGSASVTPTGGTPPYTYSWNSGQTTASVSNISAGVYSVTITDQHGCSQSKMDSVNTQPAPTAPICLVTVDSLSQYNYVIWDKSSFTDIDSFIVYREISTGNYQRLGSQPYSALSEFKDTIRTRYFPNTGNPNGGTYRYKLQARDSCGNYSQLSNYHNTIFITNNSGTFSWAQPYTIENTPNPVANYVLMRDDNSTGSWHAVSSVAGTQQTVSDPNYSTYQNTASWRVQTQWSIACAPSRLTATSSLFSSYSNIKGVLASGIATLDLQHLVNIYPTINNGIFTVDCSDLNTKDLTLEIYSVLGEVLYRTALVKVKNEIMLAGIPSGMYFARISTGAASTVKRIIIQ